MKTNRGFTLIELLVVIAIIGILSSVVLASLNSARSKGADAAIKSDLDGVRAQAEIVFNDDGNYNAVCGNGVAQDTKIAEIMVHASSTAGAPGVCSTPVSGDATEWALSSPLKAGGHWCVDSAGKGVDILSAIGMNETVCP